MACFIQLQSLQAVHVVIGVFVTKEYLGDGCYVEIDVFEGTILTTFDGVQDTNTIYLESDVVKALIDYWLRAKILKTGETR